MGRAFWILDNVTPLHQLREAVRSAQAHLFAPRAAYRMRYSPMGGRPNVPEYPANGAHLDYVLASEPSGDLKLEILDAKGAVIRTYSSNAPAPRPMRAESGGDEEMRGPGFGQMAARPLSKQVGLNRFTWDLRYEGFGPLVVPGRYQARLSMAGWTQTQPLEIKLDPRLASDGVTQADLEEQLALLLKVRDTATEARQLARQVDEALKTRGDSEGLRALRAKLVTAPGPYPQPMLIDQLQGINRMAGAADRKVGRSTIVYLEELRRELAAMQAIFKKLSANRQ
jgi:hypothetical protein